MSTLNDAIKFWEAKLKAGKITKAQYDQKVYEITQLHNIYTGQPKPQLTE